MTKPLVQRLREGTKITCGWSGEDLIDPLLHEAANDIERREMTNDPLLEKARLWLKYYARHDESKGPCYGRKHAYPDTDDSVFICRCGLSNLIKELDQAAGSQG